MQRIYRAAFGVCLGMITLAGCSSDTPVSPTSADYFPNTIGSHWTYSATGLGTESWTVTIVDSATSHGKGTRWVSDPTDPPVPVLLPFTSTSYLFQTDDTIGIHTSRPGPPLWTLIIPFEVGKKWGNTAGRTDTTEVIDQQTISVPSGTFHEVFHLKRTVTYEDCWETIELWVKPHVGIVKMHAEGGGDVCFPFLATLELSDYELRISD